MHSHILPFSNYEHKPINIKYMYVWYHTESATHNFTAIKVANSQRQSVMK